MSEKYQLVLDQQATILELEVDVERFRDVCDTRGNQIERLTAELAKVQAVVDKLPKTADGAAVAPNVEVWYPSPHDDCVYKIRNVLKRGACYMPKTGGSQVNIQYVDISQCYSTREAADDAYKAAEAAKGKTYWDGVLEAAEAAKGKT